MIRLYDIFMTDMTKGEEIFISITAENPEQAAGFARDAFGSMVAIDSVSLVVDVPKVFRMDDASEKVRAEYEAWLDALPA